MQPPEKKTLTIKIPHIRWQSLLSIRFFAVGFALLAATLFTYWFFAIHPYFWISNGRTAAFSVDLSSDIAGRILQIGPSDGETVQKGQILFVLDSDLLRAHQKQMQLQIDSLNEQARIENLRMEKSMEEYLSAAQEAELGIGSAETIKKHLASFEEAQKKSEKILSELAASRAEWEVLELQANKMTMKAPFDGVILKRSANLGSVISFGQSVYTLYDPTQVWIEAELPEQFLSSLSLGKPVRICLAAFPKKEWRGTICWIGPAASASTLPVKISIEDPAFPLKPGLSATVGLKVR